MNLQADSVQGVLFLGTGAQQEDALALWPRVFPGDGPDGFQRASASPTLQSTASGERDGFAVTLSSQVGRVDVVVTQSLGVGQAISLGGPPRIADVERAANQVSTYMKRLLAYAKISRLALVLDLAETVRKGDEADYFRAAVPKFGIPPEATDLHLQFNVAREFDTVPSARMNRLCIWTTGQVGFFSGGPAGINVGAPMAMSPFVGLKIDVNTIPGTGITNENAPAALEEVVRECVEIFRGGMERFQ